MSCRIKGCRGIRKAKDLCQKHYDSDRLRANPSVNKDKNRHYLRTERGRWMELQKSARHRGLALNLSEEEYYRLTRGAACFFCKGPLPEAGHGLDRVNNALGYSLENVLPCCKYCNRARCDDPIDSFLKWLEKVATNLRHE